MCQLERVARIELANNPWQGFRLPLHHTRLFWYLNTVSNRGPSPCKGDALPLSYPGMLLLYSVFDFCQGTAANQKLSFFIDFTDRNKFFTVKPTHKSQIVTHVTFFGNFIFKYDSVHLLLLSLLIWRKTEESNPIPVKRTWFSRPVGGPSHLHHLPVFLEQRVRFELTIFGICNPMRWATPPPLHDWSV